MLAILLFCIGACIGSFLYVVFLRTHAKTSFLHGRSACANCHRTIFVFDLIPLISFLLLKGMCRFCKHRLSLEYFIIECVTAGLFFLAAVNFILTTPDASPFLLIRNLMLFSFLILIFMYDLRYMLIPDRFTLPAIAFIFLFNLFLFPRSFFGMIAGACVIGGFFLAQYLFSNGKWVGGGDIRLGILIGVLFGVSQGLVALFLAYIFGAIVGGVLLLLKKVDRKTPIPFGTFLTFATAVTLFVGQPILEWYLSFFGI